MAVVKHYGHIPGGAEEQDKPKMSRAVKEGQQIRGPITANGLRRAQRPMDNRGRGRHDGVGRMW